MLRREQAEPAAASPLWHALATGMVRSDNTPWVQAKLTVGAADDEYEKEADRIADRVMRMPAPEEELDVQRKVDVPEVQRVRVACERKLQRQPENEEEEAVQRSASSPQTDSAVANGVARRIERVKHGGEPLPESARAYLEPRFGQDFSGVRIHKDGYADGLARQLNARAFTLGQNIAFRKGEYSPGSYAGKKLLAHELTHVVQQQGTSVTHAGDDVVRLSRSPDVVHNGYHSFYLLAGGGREVAVQFYYSGSGNQVTVKMAPLRRTALVEDTFTLPASGSFAPVIVYEDGVTTAFDLTGDGQSDVDAHVSIDALYSYESLTSASNPGDPEYQTNRVTETFAVIRWSGVEKILRFQSGADEQAWVTRPHPHPNVHFVYYNRVTREYFIPSQFNIPSTFRGVRSANTALSTLDITVLDWGESWNGFNIAGGALTYDQIDASSVENMVQQIQDRVPAGSCIGTLTIIGHGSPGSISVGDGTDRVEGRYIRGGALDSTSGIYDAELARLLARLTPMFCGGGGAVLRGCNVGDGTLGASFTQNLANLWQVPVKAHVGTVRGGGYWESGTWTEATPTP